MTKRKQVVPLCACAAIDIHSVIIITKALKMFPDKKVSFGLAICVMNAENSASCVVRTSIVQ